MSPIDLLADLPDPRDDEPSSLRSDIVDELADHLQCAFRREVVKDGDDVAARQRMLDRFGDPQRLASRLWWQAMWSRIMQQRVLSGIQWIVTVAAGVLAAAVLWQQSQLISELRSSRADEAAQRTAMIAALNQLNANSSNPNSGHPTPINPAVGAFPATYSPSNSEPKPAFNPSDAPGAAGPEPFVDLSKENAGQKTPSPLVLRFLLENGDGEIVEPESVTATDMSREVDGVQITDWRAVPSAPVPTDVAVYTGKYHFPGLEPGRYELAFTLKDGMRCRRHFICRPNEQQEMTVLCPRPRETTHLTLAMQPLPEYLKNAKCEVSCTIVEMPVVCGDYEWNLPASRGYEIDFDPLMGDPIHLRESHLTGLLLAELDLRKIAKNDRVLFLPIGPIGIRYSLSFNKKNMGGGFSMSDAASFPDEKNEDGSDKYQIRMLERGKSHWDLALPDELLAKVKDQLKGIKQTGPPVAQAAASTPIRKPAALTLKLVIDKEDGPPAQCQQISLTDSNNVVHPGNDEQAESGLFRFDHLEPDRYELEIHLSDGQSSTQDIVFRDDKPHEMTIVCPAPRKKIPVQVALKPLPESLRGGDFKIHVTCWTGDTEVGNSRWNPGQQRSQVITFDPATGQATHLKFYRGSSQADADLKELPAEDRAVFVQTGSIQYEIEASWSRQHPKLENSMRSNGSLAHTIRVDEKQWDIEVPKELLDQISARMTAEMDDK